MAREAQEGEARNRNEATMTAQPKPRPQVMVQSTQADVKPGDYFKCCNEEGTFVSFTAPAEGKTLGTVTYKDRYGKTVSYPYADPTDTVFIRRPLEEGMLATASFNGDDYPCEVKGWSPSGHQVHVLWGRSKELRTFTRRNDGRYFQKGYDGGFSLTFGVAESRMNPELTKKRPTPRAKLVDLCREYAIESFAEKHKNVGPLPSIYVTGWRVTLVRGRNGPALVTDFFTGEAIAAITTADVLHCLLSDVNSVEESRDFEDWCAEFGYDTDSRKAFATYEACQAQMAPLRAFLGSAFDRFARAEH